MTKTTLLLALLAASLVFTACQAADPQPKEAPAPAISHTPEEGDATDHDEGSEASTVEFEPAYPTEVSREGLSNEDIAQQEAEHSHAGGEPHAHDDEADADDADHHGEEGTDDNHDH